MLIGFHAQEKEFTRASNRSMCQSVSFEVLYLNKWRGALSNSVEWIFIPQLVKNCGKVRFWYICLYWKRNGLRSTIWTNDDWVISFFLLLIKTWIGLSIDQSEEASYKRFLSCCAILPARIARNQLLIDSWARKKQLAELKGNDEDLSWSIFIIGKPSGKLTKNLTYMIFQRCLVRNVKASISQRYRN